MENGNKKLREHFYSNKKPYQHEDTLLVVKGLPLNRTRRPALPDMHALSNLIQILGEGTQAFIFAGSDLKAPTKLQCEWWSREFEEGLRTMGVARTSFYIDFGTHEMTHGDDGATKSLFGRENERFCGKDFRPTKVRIFGAPAWSSSAEPTRRSFCDGIVKMLAASDNPSEENGPVTFGDTSAKPSEHSSFWVREWLTGSGARSDHYRRIVTVEWVGVQPVVV